MYPHQQRISYDYGLRPDDAYFQRERYNHRYDAVERVVLLLGSGLSTLLGLRFVFALLSANAQNGIVHAVYTVMQPFVMPFYGLFQYDHGSVGTISFQGYTLVALVAYSLLTAGIARLVGIGRY